MSEDSLKHYTIKRQVSSSDDLSAYEAVCNETCKPVFLKVIQNKALLLIVKKSSQLHKSINFNGLLRQNRLTIDSRQIIVEYNYLSNQKWQPITFDILLEDFEKIIVQIALIVDFLHIKQVVHNDLKLSNFLYNKISNKVILTDLDFLTENNSPTNALILGTAQYIAPEIIENEAFTTFTDNYALGKSIEYGLQNNKSDFENKEKLNQLTAKLTAEYPYERPQFLLDELYSCQLIEFKTYNKYLKQLLSLHLLASYRNLSQERRKQNKYLQQLVNAENYVIGVPQEIIEGLVERFLKRRTEGMYFIRSIIKNAEIKHINEYWHINLSDSDQIDLLARLYQLEHFNLQNYPLNKIINDNLLEKNYQDALHELKKQNYLRVYHTFSQIYELSNNHDFSNSFSHFPEVLKHLGLDAVSKSKYKKALKYYDRYFEVNKNNPFDFEIAYEYTITLIAADDSQKAMEKIDTFLNKAIQAANLEYEIIFKKLKASVIGKQGDYETAEEELKKILPIAVKNNHHQSEITILVALGIIAWRKEDLEYSIEYLLQAYESCKKYKLLHKNITTFICLTLLYNDLGQYSKVPAIEKATEKINFTLIDQQNVPTLQSEMCLAYLRLNNLKKAEQLLIQFVNTSSHSEQVAWLMNYYSKAGILALTKTKYDQAFQLFHKLKEAGSASEDSFNTGKAYHHLLVTSFYSGNISHQKKYINNAHIEFDKKNNNVAKCEIDLHENLINCYYFRKPNSVKLKNIFHQLFNSNSHFYAMIAFFHLLLQSDENNFNLDLNANPRFKTNLLDKKTPFYMAVNKIYRGKLSKNMSELLIGYKDAYNILYNAGLFFNAMLVCDTIAKHYKNQKQNRHVTKFLHQALKLAKNIHNPFFINKYKRELETVKQTIDHHDLIISTYLNISEIFQQIDNYDDAIKKILQLAVDLTAAERGVLLLNKRDSEDLVVKGFINCDQDSLRDIHTISLNIPASSFADDVPLIIENAQVDKRTKEYKSIIANNILSVLCIPVRYDNSISGVLYLDHHSIPALFSKDDYKIVQSISNFISVILHTLDSYRNIKTINKELIESASQKGQNDTFISNNLIIKNLFNNIPNIARSNANILIVGESGTGKEIIANMIHALSNRSDMPMVKFNCAAVAETLIDSELFGIEKNTATGVAERDGKFSAADGGTLFMDEIGDMPPIVQAKLLRAIENQEFEKVGSSKTIYTDIRFIAATNKDLKKEIKNNNFRNDLYQRINTITLEIPPLNQRIDDIPLLIDYFFSIYSKRNTKTIFSADTYKILMSYHWPGNVRELKNLVERCMILFPDEVITPDKLPMEINRTKPLTSNKINSNEIEKSLIYTTLQKYNGNKRKTSEELHIPYTTLLRKIKKYNLPF